VPRSNLPGHASSSSKGSAVQTKELIVSTRDTGVRNIQVLVGALLLIAAVLAGGARAADSPLATVAVNPGGSQTAAGSAAQSGHTDACLTGQRSTVSPNTNSPAQINSGACATSSSQADGTEASGASRGSGRAPGTGSSGSRASGSRIASVGRLRIARVQYFTNGVGLTKRFRVLVTVRDYDGRRVGNAIVSIGALPGARHTVSATHATFSNRFGQAGLFLTATRPMLGQRVLLKIAARTPRASAATVGSVLLPRHPRR
jgi:hypothetical protein